MAPARVDLDVVVSLQRVDGAVAARDRAEAGLLLAEPQLVAPVEPLAVRSCGVARGGGGRRRRRRRGRRGSRRGGAAHPAPRSRWRRRTRRRRRGLAHRAVLRRDLAAPRAVEQAHPRLARGDRLDELVRAVGRGVGGDDDLQPVGGIVEREQVLEPALDHGLLVVGRDDHAHGRLGRQGSFATRRSRTRAERAGGQRVADVRPRERRRATPRRAPSPRPSGECSPPADSLARDERPRERPSDPCAPRDREARRGRPCPARHVPRARTRRARLRDDARGRRRRTRRGVDGLRGGQRGRRGAAAARALP